MTVRLLSSIESFVLGSAYPERAGYIVMMWSYLDDSSDDTRSRFYSAGGFFSMDYQWVKFGKKWDEVTKDLREHFHATDCEAGFGQFAKWPKAKRDGLFKSICDLVKEVDIGAFCSTVSIHEYRTVFREANEHAPYLLCVGDCIANIATIVHESNRVVGKLGLPEKKVSFWVEGKRGTAGAVSELFYELKAISQWKSSTELDSIMHTGKDNIGVQAADFIAREAFKYFDNEGSRRVRKPIISLADHLTFHRWNADELRCFSNGSVAEVHAAFADKMMRRRQSTPFPSDGSYPTGGGTLES